MNAEGCPEAVLVIDSSMCCYSSRVTWGLIKLTWSSTVNAFLQERHRPRLHDVRRKTIKVTASMFEYEYYRQLSKVCVKEMCNSGENCVHGGDLETWVKTEKTLDPLEWESQCVCMWSVCGVLPSNKSSLHENYKSESLNNYIVRITTTAWTFWYVICVWSLKNVGVSAVYKMCEYFQINCSSHSSFSTFQRIFNVFQWDKI